jgi:hypothetical protein
MGTAWMHLLGTLASDFGKGYPLYMQGPLFAAKQLETQLGSYTELRHDTILYEKPNYAELGDGWDEAPPKPLPMGLVEPNLPFWGELLRVVDYIAEGFEENDLFPQDLEEYGALTMFRDTVSRCGKLAAKQLEGKPLTEEEYEFIRLFPLDYMAAAADGYGGVPPIDVYRSALVVDIQTGNLSPGAAGSPVILDHAGAGGQREEPEGADRHGLRPQGVLRPARPQTDRRRMEEEGVRQVRRGRRASQGKGRAPAGEELLVRRSATLRSRGRSAAL